MHSCLVEVQPTLLDVSWLQARAGNNASSTSSSDNGDDETGTERGQSSSRSGREAQGGGRSRRKQQRLDSNEARVLHPDEPQHPQPGCNAQGFTGAEALQQETPWGHLAPPPLDPALLARLEEQQKHMEAVVHEGDPQKIVEMFAMNERNLQVLEATLPSAQFARLSSCCSVSAASCYQGAVVTLLVHLQVCVCCLCCQCCTTLLLCHSCCAITTTLPSPLWHVECLEDLSAAGWCCVLVCVVGHIIHSYTSHSIHFTQPEAFQEAALDRHLSHEIKQALSQHQCSLRDVVQARAWFDCGKVRAVL